ncbi:MAG: roadblock/LC7 domain-containing protein [Candidatus Thorarchaeota archaeon]
MSSSDDEILLKQILTTIINSTAGLKYAIIIDDTGINIASQSKFTFTENDHISVDKIGAIGGAVFTAGEEQGEILGYGTINLQITEYEKGMIFSIKLDNGALVLATDFNVQVGFIRALLKRWAPRIAKILSRYLESSDQEELKEELKELFSTNSLGF